MQAKVPVQAVKAEPQARCWVARAARLLSCAGTVCTVGTDASSLNPPCLLLQKVLSSQAGSTVDSIVLLNQLQEWADMQQLLSQARDAARGQLAGLPS